VLEAGEVLAAKDVAHDAQEIIVLAVEEKAVSQPVREKAH